MPFPAIGRYEDRNFTGICHFDVVPVEDIQSMPPEIGGNVAASIVLVSGAAWARVYLENAGGFLTEQWRLREGDQYSTAEAGGAIAMDRLALMPYLWSLKGGRYVVVARTQNGDQLVMGTPTEPVMALVSERRTGDADRMESERNGYQIAFSLTRRRPVPFYGGTVPEPGSADLAEAIDAATWAEIEAELDAGQLADAVESICTLGGGDVVVRDTADATTVATVTAPDSYPLPQSRIKYKDVANADQELPASNTEFDGTHLKPATQIPRRALRNSAGTGYNFVTAADLVDDTVPTAPNGSFRTTDGATPIAAVPAGADVNAQQSVIKYKDAADDSQVTAASDTEFASGTLRPATEIPRREILLTGGTGTGRYASTDALIANTLPTVPQQLNVTWGAGAGDTLGVVLPASMQGVAFSFVSETGSNGTITISVNNGSSFAAAPFTPSTQKVIFRRTTTTSEHSALYTTA